jgi:prevent-host-death family protein
VAGSHEVAGSSPASSIAADCTPTTVGCNPFRDRFGDWIERVAAGEEVIVTRRGRPLLRLLPI